MKPIRLLFQAFGPYAGRQEINFEALAHAGLFLIRGETGAGKTVILDAVTFALYGRSSGGERGELGAMRCQFAAEDTPTEVQFEFEINGRRYCFIRRLRICRNRSGDTEYLPEQDALFCNAEGEFVPFFENPKQSLVSAKAKEVIGLEYEQFRQVVILPQGQFERLLVAGSEEKEALLTTLFDVGQWGEAAERLHERVLAEQYELETLRQEKAALCRAVECERESEITIKKQVLRERIGRLQTEYQAVEQEATQAFRTLEEAVALDRSFARLEAAEKMKIQLEEQRRKRETLGLRDLAEPYDRWRKAVRDARLVKENVQFSRLAEADCRERRKGLEAEEKQALEQREMLRKKAERKPALDAELKLFEQRKALAEEAEATAAQLEQRRAERKRCEETYRVRVEESSRAAALHLQLLSHELAEGLQDNTPCPVCGSIHHPAPARVAQGKMTREQLQKINQALEKANQAAMRIGAACDALEVQVRAAQERLERAGGYDAAAHSAIQNQGKAAAAAVNKLETLDKKFAEFTERRSQLDLREKTILTSLHNGETRLARMEAAEEAVRLELDRLDPDGSVRARLQQEKPSPELFERLERELRAYDEQLFAVLETVRTERVQMEGKQRPNLEALRSRLEQFQERAKQAHSAAEVARAQITRLSETEKKVLEINRTLEKRVEAFDRLAAFSQLVRGENGVSLQRYVLGVMLSAVTAEANRLLEKIHDGRYQIYRELEDSGRTRKAGLELEVLDRQSGGRRSVSTLSGGEKFLAALALSIGLSVVTQTRAGGKTLGVIFIDEGFGTLDTQSLQDALGALAAVRSFSGMVGVISHVGLLRESIEPGIEVVKTANGSELRVVL